MAERVHTFLVIKRGGKNEKIVVLDTQDLSVGRAPENDLVLEDEELSRNHAAFRRTESGWVVQNYSNSNSTLVNGEAVTSHPIKSKDVIKVADSELIYYQVTKNPVTVGLPVDYASRLKGFGPKITVRSGTKVENVGSIGRAKSRTPGNASTQTSTSASTSGVRCIPDHTNSSKRSRVWVIQKYASFCRRR